MSGAFFLRGRGERCARQGDSPEPWTIRSSWTVTSPVRKGRYRTLSPTVWWEKGQALGQSVYSRELRRRVSDGGRSNKA